MNSLGTKPKAYHIIPLSMWFKIVLKIGILMDPFFNHVILLLDVPIVVVDDDV